MKLISNDMIKLLKHNYKAVIMMSIFVLLNSILTFVIPIYVSSIINRIGEYDIFKLIAVFITATAIVLVIKSILVWLKKQYSIKFRTSLNVELYKDLLKVRYDKLNEKGLIYYLENINLAVNNINMLVTQILPSLISITFIMILSFVFIANISFYIAIFLLGLILLQWAFYKLINKVLKEKSLSLQSICGKNFSYVLSIIENLDFVKSRSSHKGILKLIEPKLEKIHYANEDVNAFAGNASLLFSTFIQLIQYFLYLYFAYQTIINRAELGSFVFVTIIINIFFSNLSSISQISLSYSESLASWHFIENEIRSNYEKSGEIPVEHIENIEFRNLDVKYPDNQLISDVNITLNKGDIVFIKGETGSGKSSLVKSLLSFNNSEGIYINKRKYSEYSLSSIRDKIAYVSQNFSLIEDNLENNLRVGDEIDIEPVMSVAFFSKFVKNGKLNDLEVLNKGGNLSGGDKQKLILARTILRDYDVLILDEVTSSMDKETEQATFDELMKNSKDRINIIISHNDDLQKYANRIFLVQNKKITEL